MGEELQVKNDDALGVSRFLKKYPGMSIDPTRDGRLSFSGIFDFAAAAEAGAPITDAYHIRIYVPGSFPRGIPVVKELGKKIPNDGNHHVNADGTLCMGSGLRLLSELSKAPTLLGFAERCIVPYLYAISHKLRFGGEFVFGELAHGEKGIVDDYMRLFELSKPDQVPRTLALLGVKKRIANKMPCPCGCGLRLGKCRLHNTLNQFRKMASVSWFKANVCRQEN